MEHNFRFNREDKDGKSYFNLESSGPERWEEIKKTGPGRPKAIPNPGQLWDFACEYFKECELTPWVKKEFRGKYSSQVLIPCARPFTFGGFDEFLRRNDIIAKLEDYRKNRDGKYTEFSEVITRIENIIRTQKLEGAMVGAFDARIVSAELGLSNKVEVEIPIQKFIIGGKEVTLG